MTSKPRLYARIRAHQAQRAVSSSSKPDVLVLLDEQADSKVIIHRLSKEPILCQVIVLSDVNSLTQYYQSHRNTENNDNCVYLVQSASFTDQINQLGKRNDDFYTILTCPYILDLDRIPSEFDEQSEMFNDEEQLAKRLRDYLNSLLTLSDVELSSQSVSLETPCFTWFQFMFTLLLHLERTDIGIHEVIDRFQISYNNESSRQTVEEFIHTYSSEKAIEWCMKDSFYFGHINRILRSKDIKQIFTHRTIIRDLEQCRIS